MAVKWFLIAKAGGTAAAVGGLSYGGYWAYDRYSPKSWMDILQKEGFSQFIDKENQNGEKIWLVLKEENNGQFIEGLTRTTEYDTAKQKCSDKLMELTSKGSSDYATNREKILKSCVRRAPQHAKDLFRQKALEEKKGGEALMVRDEDYEVMFAVYRHEHEEKEGFLQFLDWLNQGTTETALTKKSEIKDGATRLKAKCQKIFNEDPKQPWANEKELRSGALWCRRLNYSTIREKLKAKDSSLMTNTVKSWSGMKDKWKATEAVKKIVNKDKAEKNEEFRDWDYRVFCTNHENRDKKLNEEGVYPDIYLVYWTLCYQQPSKAS